jgi:hypothetical protein
MIIIGDYFHTKASYLSTQMDFIEVSAGLSVIEEYLSIANILKHDPITHYHDPHISYS